MARRDDNRRDKREEENNEFVDRLVHINRVAKALVRVRRAKCLKLSVRLRKRLKGL